MGNFECLTPWLNCACCCCMSLYQNVFRYFQKNAYMDVVINSQAFLPAAYHAVVVMEHEVTEAMTLNGATWFVQSAGMGGICALGSLMCWCLCTQCAAFNHPGIICYVVIIPQRKR